MKKIFSVCVYSGFAITGLFLLGFALYATITLLWSKDMDDVKAANAIIVLTGSKGRIESGFDLLLANKAPRLLISGVTDGVTFDEIIDVQTITDESKKKLRQHCCIELDYVADTTETNATESAIWIKNNDITSIILVTSHLHMPRASLQFNRALPDYVDIQTYPIQNERRLSLFTSYNFWLYSAQEYIKYLGSWARIKNQK